MLAGLVDDSKLMPGASALVEYLQDKGFFTTILTGGVKAFADRLQRELRISHAIAACEYFFKMNGALDSWSVLPTDFLGKVSFMKLLIEEHGARAEDCVFVGDGRNDVALAKAVGISISFNGPSELKAVATEHIEQSRGMENLTEVVSTLDGYLD